MNRPAALVGKELRAVAPLAAACLAVMLAGTFMDDLWRGVALLAYLAGSMGIGASLVGHELGHGTLGTLLAQPVARGRLLVAKTLAGALALAVMGATAFSIDLLRGLAFPDYQPGAGAVLVVFTTALCVAPWLTLLTRHALAGTIGALISPVVLALLLSIVGLFQQDDPGRYRMLGGALLAVSVIAAVHGWRLFTRRLEALDGHGRQIHFGLARRANVRASAGGPSRTTSLRQLLGKEARLQQLPMVISGLYVGASLLAWFTTGIVPAEIDPRQDLFIWFYAGTMALLIGAVASAEERQMGAMPWQVILPVPAWQQFTVKTIVAVGLSLVLTNTIPVLVAGTTTAAGGVYPFVWSPTFQLTTVGLTLTGLYVSSLSTSSVRALVGAMLLLAGLGAAYLAGQWLGRPVGTFAYDATHPWSASLLAGASELPRRTIERGAMSVMGMLAGILVAAAWRFALANHSRAEDTRARAWRQGVVLAVAVLAGSLSVSSVVAAVRFGPSGRSVISGVVVDRDGTPVPNVLVRTAERRFFAGARRLRPTGIGAVTDSRGRFRLPNLAPGEHYPIALSGVFADRWMLLSGRLAQVRGPSGFAPTFHPRTRDAGSAGAVIVDGRTEIGGLTIELVPAPTAQLAGRLTDPDGQPVAGGLVSLATSPENPPASALLQAVTRSDADGHYTFDTVPPGRYLLEVRPSRLPGQPLGPAFHGWRELTLDGSDMLGVDLLMHAGATIRGRLTFEGDGPRGAPEHMRVRARQTGPIGTGSQGARVAQDWTFELGNLGGTYVFRPDILADLVVNRRRVENPAAETWTLKAVRLDGRDITDMPLNLALGDAIDGLELVLTDEAGRITGLVRPSEARPDRGPVVLVLAADPGQWDASGPLRETAPVDRTRVFRTRALPPGDYLVVALASRFGLTLDDPEFLEELRPLATPVHLDAGETVELTLDIVR